MPQCASSHALSNDLLEKMSIHTGYSGRVSLQCVSSNAAAFEKLCDMNSCTGCISLSLLHSLFSNSALVHFLQKKTFSPKDFIPTPSPVPLLTVGFCLHALSLLVSN